MALMLGCTAVSPKLGLPWKGEQGFKNWALEYYTLILFFLKEPL